MLLINTYLKQSPLHGLGVFSSEPIKAGTVIWRFDEILDIKISIAQYISFPEIQKNFVRHFAYLSKQSYNYILCADNARYMNHSANPNIKGVYGPFGDEGYEIAVRDILPDQELTCDYSTFDILHDSQSTTWNLK